MFRRVIGYATFEHYARHLWPIIEALRDRGIDASMFGSRRDVWWAEYMHPARAKMLDGTLWLVAGSVDSEKLSGLPQVYVEHGAGQTYDADERGVAHRSYSNGTIPEARLFLCPNEYVATRRRRSQPEVPAVVTGPAILDEYHPLIGQVPDDADERVVAIAFHWDCQLVPESRSAFDHYAPSLTKLCLALRRNGIIPVGHAHPRIAARARRQFTRAGMEWWEYDDVMARASALAVDNSSIGYEFASLDRPVVWLNAPWYRRHVHHGLRFWECIPGPQADEWTAAVDHLTDAVNIAHRSSHYPCLDAIYPVLDGMAAQRSAESITLLL